jgi:hypothetical protein
MKKFTFLAAAALFAALNVNANVIYVATTASGNGSGSSWDNAMGITADLDNYVGDVGAGDIAYLKEGTYTGKQVTITPGATFIGGFPASATGTDISGYNPWVNKTIIDAKGNNVTSSRQALLKVSGAASDGTPTTIKGITVTGCVGSSTTTYYGTALNSVEGAYVVIEDVVFKDNTSYCGGCVIPASGKFYAKHCVWTGNKNIGTGGSSGASVMTGRGSSDAKTNIVLEGCVMVDNGLLTASTYGGYINTQDNCVNLMMVNCYADGGDNTIKQNGGFIRTGKTPALHLFAFNTFCNFKASDSAPKGHVMSINQTDNLYFQGNIVTSSAEVSKIDDSTANAIFLQNGTSSANVMTNVKSYGYNTVTGIIFNKTDNEGSFCSNTLDNWVAPTTAKVFGDNVKTEKDGRYYIEPTSAYGDVVLDDALKAFNDFTMPDCFSWAKVDLSLDILGNKRAATTYRGAYDPNGTPVVDETTTGIENVADNSAKVTVKSLGNGNFAIAGVEGNAEVYDLSGRLVNKQALTDGTLQLDNVASGIYLVRFANATVKLAR